VEKSSLSLFVISVCRKPDDYLDHRIYKYCIPAHIYLNSGTLLFFVLVQGARALCKWDSLNDELYQGYIWAVQL
jgi:hypothetical protein